EDGKQVGQVRLSVGHVESSVWVVVIGATWEAVAGILGVDKEDLDGFRVDVTMEYEMPLPEGSEPRSTVFRTKRKRGQLDKRELRWKRFPVLDWDDLYISLTIEADAGGETLAAKYVVAGDIDDVLTKRRAEIDAPTEAAEDRE
ncbi:MAG: hypothetical protein GY851_18400, partial [bacterium]|nr:hypothetical protein [bacterium]